MGAGEIAAKADGGARQPDRLIVIASDVLGQTGRAIIERQRTDRAGLAASRGAPPRCLLASGRKSQCGGVIVLGLREIRIEPQRQIEFGQRIVEAPRNQIDGAKRIMRPGVFAVGADRRQRGTLGDLRDVFQSSHPIWAPKV